MRVGPRIACHMLRQTRARDTDILGGSEVRGGQENPLALAAAVVLSVMEEFVVAVVLSAVTEAIEVVLEAPSGRNPSLVSN